MFYPDGTIFESAQHFGPVDSFGNGCIFAAGCEFQNPCIFGDGCVFEQGCRLVRRYPPVRPPHQTGDGCVFDDSCFIEYTIIGAANVISNPTTYAPVSQGAGTTVNAPPRNYGFEVSSAQPETVGQLVSNGNVSTDWQAASNPAGFDVDDCHITSTSWNITT